MTTLTLTVFLEAAVGTVQRSENFGQSEELVIPIKKNDRTGWVFAAVSWLQSSVIQTSGAPADMLCTGKIQKDGTVHFSLSKDIHGSSCDSQWLVNKQVTAFTDGNEDTSFMFPIINATAKTATMEVCPDKLEYNVICLESKVHKEVLCSCNTSGATSDATTLGYPATLDYLAGNETFLEDTKDVGFTNRRIGSVAVVTFIVLVLVLVVIVICLKDRLRSSYEENLTV